MCIRDREWRDLLKIALDYIIRYKFHYTITPTVRGLASLKHKSFPIYPNNTQVINVTKWPKFDKNNIRPNRLALLICAGLNFHNPTDIDDETEDQINDLLEEIWKTIRGQFLTADGTSDGLRLNLETNAAFELSDNLWLCPVKKKLIDKIFRGYSPWITGRLEPSNIDTFKVSTEVSFPLFPFPFNRNQINEYDQESTINWINNDTEINSLKNKGIWNGLHERIINFKPLYLAGEHSAECSPARYNGLKFIILSCNPFHIPLFFSELISVSLLIQLIVDSWSYSLIWFLLNGNGNKGNETSVETLNVSIFEGSKRPVIHGE